MSDGRGPVGKAAKEEQEKLEKEKKQNLEEARQQDPCLSERQGYETNCARSWVSLQELLKLYSHLSVFPTRSWRLTLFLGILPLPSRRSITLTKDEYSRNGRR